MMAINITPMIITQEMITTDVMKDTNAASFMIGFLFILFKIV